MDVEETLAAIDDAIWDYEVSPDAVRFNAPAEARPRRLELPLSEWMWRPVDRPLSEWMWRPVDRPVGAHGPSTRHVTPPARGVPVFESPLRPDVAEAAEAELAAALRDRVAEWFDLPVELLGPRGPVDVGQLFERDELDSLSPAFRWRAEVAMGLRVARPESFVVVSVP